MGDREEPGAKRGISLGRERGDVLESLDKGSAREVLRFFFIPGFRKKETIDILNIPVIKQSKADAVALSGTGS
jgi:hypothetical protein